MAVHIWNLNCPKHRGLYALFAFERLFNANSCFGNYQISADVTGIVTDTKKNPARRLGSFNLTQAVA